MPLVPDERGGVHKRLAFRMRGMNRLLALSFCLSTMFSLHACAPAVVVGAGAGATAANDRRSVGAIVDDAAIELKIGALIKADKSLVDTTHISITSVNGVVLLTGEAETAALRDKVVADARNVASVRMVVDEIRIARPTPIGNRTRDTWITTKVKSKLINTRGLDSSQIKVVTEARSVYLLGLVTQEQGHLAAEVARRIGGVARVVKLFEYID